LIFSLTDSEIQRINRRFNFSKILISIRTHKQIINSVESERLNRKKRIAQLNKNLRLNINLNVIKYLAKADWEQEKIIQVKLKEFFIVK